MKSFARNTIALVVTTSLALPLAPHAAKAGNFAAAAGGFVAGAIVGGILNSLGKQDHRTGTRKRQPSSNDSGSGSSGKSRGDEEAALASLGVDKNLDGILRTVTFKSVQASAGANDSLRIGRRGSVADNKADLQTELAAFVEAFTTMADGTVQNGDVSRVTVESGLDEIYESKELAGLRAFENLQGENWSPEQLKYKIIVEARRRIDKFRSGNNKGIVTMAQVRQILAESARDVYMKLFEISELIGMSKHIADFDRELYEGGKLGGDAEALSTTAISTPASSNSDEEAYPGDAPKQDSATEPERVEPASKMKFITPEMVRIARVMADDVPLELGREDRDFAEAFRYRITRATVDCFIALATKKNDDRAPASGDVSQTQALDGRYEDLIKTFQAAVVARDRVAATTDRDGAGNNRDGVCRSEIYLLAGLGEGGVATKGGADANGRDLALLKAPQPTRAVWTGTGWDTGGAPATRGN